MTCTVKHELTVCVKMLSKANGTALESFIGHELENRSENMDELQIKWLAGALYGAGAETVRICSASQSSHPSSSSFFAVRQRYEYVLLDDDFTSEHPVSGPSGG